MSQQHTAVGAIFFAVIAYLPSSHSLTSEKSVRAAPPIIQRMEQSSVELGSPATVVAQHGSIRPSPCRSRRQIR